MKWRSNPPWPLCCVVPLGCVLSSWPGLARPSTPSLCTSGKDVDGRHKAGHDGGAEAWS
jgi:hypothetical protein